MKMGVRGLHFTKKKKGGGNNDVRFLKGGERSIFRKVEVEERRGEDDENWYVCMDVQYLPTYFVGINQ